MSEQQGEKKGRRPRGTGSLYFDETKQRHVGVIDLGWIDGKRRRPKVYGKTQAEVIAKLKKTQRRVDDGDLSTTSVTLEKWLRYWLDEIKRDELKPGTFRTYSRNVRLYLIPCLGRVRLDRLEPRHVRELHKFMRKQELANRTIIQAHRILSSALADAMREKKVTSNVAALIKAPAAKGKQRRPLTVDEILRFLRTVREDRLGARWLIAFLMGLRQGEILGMTWDRLDLDAGTYALDWQLQRVPYEHGCGEKTTKGFPCGRKRDDRCPERRMQLPRDFDFVPLETNFVLQETKTTANRRLVLPEPVVLALRFRYVTYLEERESWEHDHGLIFTREDGRPLDSGQDLREWHRILQAAEIPDDTSQHAARHTTASVLLAMGTSEQVIMDVLGHSQIVTTRGYMHVDNTLARIALGRLAELLTGTGEDASPDEAADLVAG